MSASTHRFTYYMHDDYQSDERLDHMKSQMPGVDWSALTDEEWVQLIGRPFYEVAIECEFNTDTGAVTMLGFG